MKFDRRFSSAILLPAALTALLGASSAFGETSCKGLEKSKCGATPNCHWVDPYTRKDGVKVNGYCRTTSQKKSAPTTSTPKKTTPPTTH